MPRIFLNGDSTTYGYWDDEKGGWANRFKIKLSATRDTSRQIINLATSNQTLDRIIDRFPKQLQAYDRARSLGIFMLGGADACIRKDASEPQNPLEVFKGQLPVLGDTLRQLRVTPMFVGMFQINEARARENLTNGTRVYNDLGLQYVQAVSEYARSIDATFIDVDGLRPNVDVLSFDGIHPNELGHEIIATAVAEHAEQRLARPLLTYLQRDTAA